MEIDMPENPPLSSEDTRQRIIAAAMQLFGQVGYTRASTRSIAETAGVNEVTLFRHFGSKKNLLMACMQTFNASGFSATFEVRLSGDYPSDIALMARLQLQNTTENLNVLRLLLSDARNVPELQEAMLSGGGGNMALVAAYFQRQIQAGVVRPELPAEALASAFDSLFSTPVIFANLFQDNQTPVLPDEKTLAALVDLFVRGTQALEANSTNS
jgi:AcrR family transcriptional regulator